MTIAFNQAVENPEADAHDRAPSRIGLVVAGTYRIVRHIGAGGSSDVFEAEHLRLGTCFAIKLLRGDVDRSRRAVQRFRREAKVVARLRSEHIVRVLDCGELEDSTPYLVMERLEGEDLRRLLNREMTLPARRAVQLIREACDALTEVHQAGLVHRDLKPENLFVCRRTTGEDWCKVLDFGVAKMEASLATAQGAIIGTVRYMAPEQLADGASVGPATDVYALGTILYECLSGRSLHAGETIQEVMFSVMNRTPVALGTLCPSLPKALVEAVERCVAKQPVDRPQQASELARLLASAVANERSARSDTTSPDEEPPTEASRSAFGHPARGALGPSPSPISLLVPVAVAALVGAAGAWLAATAAREGDVPGPVANRNSPPVAKSASSHRETATTPAETQAASSVATDPRLRSAVTAEPIASTQKATTDAATATRARIQPRLPPPARKQAQASPQAPTAPLGSFDQANPYGE